MPFPAPLVVKKGSKAFAITSGGMPTPVSATAISTYCPASSRIPGVSVVEVGVHRLDGQPPAVRHGVARIDAKIEDRVLELRRIGWARHTPAASTVSTAICSPSVRSSSSDMPETSLFVVTARAPAAAGERRPEDAGSASRRAGRRHGAVDKALDVGFSARSLR